MRVARSRELVAQGPAALVSRVGGNNRLRTSKEPPRGQRRSLNDVDRPVLPSRGRTRSTGPEMVAAITSHHTRAPLNRKRVYRLMRVDGDDPLKNPKNEYDSLSFGAFNEQIEPMRRYG